MNFYLLQIDRNLPAAMESRSSLAQGDRFRSVVGVVNNGTHSVAYIMTTHGQIIQQSLLPGFGPPPILRIHNETDNICCYFLRSLTSRRIYIGATVELSRRIRQHNGEIEGGAKKTRKGRPWKIVAYVTGFPTFQTALQFEWRNQHPPTRRQGMPGKVHNLADVLWLPQWTSNSPPSNTLYLTVHWRESYRLPSCPPWGCEVSEL